MPSNRAGDATASSQGKGWPSLVRRLSLARLLVFFAILLAGDIAAQLARIWLIRRAPAGDADRVSVATAVVLAAFLLGTYAVLVRTLERRKAHELAPGAIQGMAGKDGWIPMRRRATRS